MKKRSQWGQRKIGALTVFVMLLCIAFTSMIVTNVVVKSNPGDTLYESYDVSYEWDSYWPTAYHNHKLPSGYYVLAQTFTVGNTGANQDHYVNSVKLLLQRNGLPGWGTVAIYTTYLDAGSQIIPTNLIGPPLCSVAYNFSTLPLTPHEEEEWIEFTFDTPAVLLANTQYAIVLTALNSTYIAPQFNCVIWRMDPEDDGDYTGGQLVTQSFWWDNWPYSGGGELHLEPWIVYFADFMFKEYGTPLTANNPPTITLIYPTNGSTDISLEPSCCIRANDIDGDNLDITWATNVSGSWVDKHTDSVSANSTVSYTFTDFNGYNTRYYWKIYVDDGTDVVSKWFYFTTEYFTGEPGNGDDEDGGNSGQLIPIGVAGWVYMRNGSRAANAFVTVSNVNESISVTTTTNATGAYAIAIGGKNHHIIRVNCSHLGEAGSNTTEVDVSKVTHWVNLTLSLAAIPPVARFSYTPDYPRVGEPVVFTDYSTDADGTIVEWIWDYGDGSTHVGKSASHTYKSEGFYDVKLKVTDNSDLSDTAKKTLQVLPVDPEEMVFIPPRQPPKYPLEPYTIPEMYQVIRGDKLQMSHEEIIVVVIDTGVTPRLFNNTDLSDIKILHHPNYDSGLDDNGHGTFVNAIVHHALEKWSPESIQYSIKALDESGVCLIEYFLEAMDMAKDLHPHIVTISAGTFGKPGDAFCRKVDELRNDGIIVTVAAGNSGPTPSTILSPACGRSSLAIGSIDPMKTILNRSDDMVSVWSSRGPVPRIFPRPSFVSPGESILGPWMYGEIVGSGTSFSTPFVAGGSMLIYANNKPMLDMVKTIYGIIGMKGLAVGIIEESLAEGCFDKGNRNSYGWGIVDIEKANEKVYMKCLLWIILFFGILTGIIIGIVIVVWLYKKPPKEKTAAKKPTGSIKYL